MNSLKCSLLIFIVKLKKFVPKKYKIVKKLKTLPISRNFVIWFCDLHLLFSYQLFQNFENTPKLARFANLFLLKTNVFDFLNK